MDEILKEIACIAGYDIREELLMKEIYLELPENRQKTNKDIAGYITEFVQDNRNTKEPEIRNAFHKLLLWIRIIRVRRKIFYQFFMQINTICMMTTTLPIILGKQKHLQI